jgi:hypothetical protein
VTSESDRKLAAMPASRGSRCGPGISSHSLHQSIHPIRVGHQEAPDQVRQPWLTSAWDKWGGGRSSRKQRGPCFRVGCAKAGRPCQRPLQPYHHCLQVQVRGKAARGMGRAAYLQAKRNLPYCPSFHRTSVRPTAPISQLGHRLSERIGTLWRKFSCLPVPTAGGTGLNSLEQRCSALKHWETPCKSSLV